MIKSFGAIRLQIFGRNIIDFSEGLLSNIETGQLGDDSTKAIRSDYVGLHEDSKSFTITNKGAVYFERSSEKSDGGQSYVPFFDGNEINFDDFSPISGVGLVHYTNHKDYAGYIRPTIASLHYRNLFDTQYD